MQVRALCTYVDPMQARPTNHVLWEAKQVWQNMLLLCVLSYHRAYNTFTTWYFVIWASTTTTNKQQYIRHTRYNHHSIQQLLYTGTWYSGVPGISYAYHCAQSSERLATFLALHVLCNWCVLPESVQYPRNIMRLFLDKTRARGAQICYAHVCTFGFSERRVLVPRGVGRWAVRRQ